MITIAVVGVFVAFVIMIIFRFLADVIRDVNKWDRWEGRRDR